MALLARYTDGHVSGPRRVEIMLDAPAEVLAITDAADGTQYDRWPVAALFTVPSRKHELRLGVDGRPYGARLVFAGADDVAELRRTLPGLARRDRAEGFRQLTTIVGATGALAGVLLAYIFGVPLLAGPIAAVVPPAWESALGETADTQINAALGGPLGLFPCDPDPASLANRAIDRFAREVMQGSASPFAPSITVVHSPIANAFALPGGRSYYFSAMLEATATADEFAGVMAHELGHIHYRHGLEGLISSSATGLLIGFVLGDLTGLSIAGGVGAALIDTRFSREAERAADLFAADAGRRVGFDPAALADLLERVAPDTGDSAFTLFSSHPLTAERRRTFEALRDPTLPTNAVFSPAEWQAIKAMCS